MVVRELGSDWDSEVSYYPLLFLCVGVCGLEGGASSDILFSFWLSSQGLRSLMRAE